MVSRTSTRKWRSVAIGLGLMSAISTLESRLQAQTAPTPYSAVREADRGTEADAARDLLKKGRDALKAGDTAKAEQFARQAQSKKVAAAFWDKDSPESLLTEIAAAKAKSLPNADPKALLKMAREALAANRFDDAQALASRANASNQRWGIIEDTPAKCLDDIQKSRARADRAESVRLLGDARKLFNDQKYDEAESLAYRAERLHGPYGTFELGDRPMKLLADIQTARAKVRKPNLPPPPVVVKSSDKDKGTTTAKAPPPPTWPTDDKSVAKTDVKPAVMPVSATETAASSKKAQAVKLLADGRADMAAGRFSEARGKFLEAQKSAGEFTPGEDNPIRAMNELSAAVTRQIGEVLKDASAAVDGVAQANRQERLKRARLLAGEFGFDARPIESALAQTRGAADAGLQKASAVGLTLLDKARLEMKRGQLQVARELATEVHNGPYNAQADAAAVLRSIDAEEQNLRVGAATRKFEAGVAAFTANDFAQAMAILREVDAALLPAAQQAQLNSLCATCEQKVQALASVPAAEAPAASPPPAIVPAAMNEPAPATPQAAPSSINSPAAPALVNPPAALPQPAATAAKSATGDALVDQVKALQKVEFQRLREEGLKAQSESVKLFERGETDRAIEMLEGFIAKVKGSQLDAADVNLLTNQVQQRLGRLNLLKAQKDSETRISGKKQAHDAEKGRDVIAKQRKDEQIKELLKQHDQLVKEGKYAEARLVAAKAKALNPEDPALAALETISQVRFNDFDNENAKKNRENMFVRGLNQAENPGPYVDSNNPLVIDPVQMQIARERGSGVDTIHLRNRSEAEREIQHKLSTVVDLNFTNAPLSQVIDDLKLMTGINIVPDTIAFEEDGVRLDTPVTIKIDKIKLESGLKVLLSSVRLTSVIADDVLKVTTERRARGKLEQRVFRVADLVMPIEDYQQPNSMNLERAMQRVIDQQGIHMGGVGATPANNGNFQLRNGTAVSTAGADRAMSTAPGTTNGGPQALSQIASPVTQKQTMHEMLIRLIQNTVAPQTWAEVGGAGTVEFMPIGMALVVNQTPDVQEQVADLLEALRRLQDVQVAIEIRMITLSETFFERIGLDFNLNVKTDQSTSRFEPQITTNNFKPLGQVNDFSPNRMIVGLNPAGSQNPGPTGNFTGDLDIPIRTSSFQYSIPPFAYPNNPGFDGGLSLGLAFLSDIQVYMFMEAAQGDRRVHVMQAPKLTMYNGQTGSISVQDQQFFVTNVGVVGFGGQIVFVPLNNPFPLGVEVTMQPVVSADRRFVRLNANVRLANLSSALVPLFPITTFITPVFEGGAQGQPIPFTQFVQQPALSLVSIQTSVSIPDGGTVIMGGLKTLSEGRNEFGPPVLSKVPYVNRLFKNVGFGRETQSLLIMVTPRIIINAEEETKQTGVISSPDQ